MSFLPDNKQPQSIMTKHLHITSDDIIDSDNFLTWLQITMSFVGFIEKLLETFDSVLLKSSPSERSFKLSVPRTHTIGRLLTLLQSLGVEYQASETSLE